MTLDWNDRTLFKEECPIINVVSFLIDFHHGISVFANFFYSK